MGASLDEGQGDHGDDEDRLAQRVHADHDGPAEEHSPDEGGCSGAGPLCRGRVTSCQHQGDEACGEDRQRHGFGVRGAGKVHEREDQGRAQRGQRAPARPDEQRAEEAH